MHHHHLLKKSTLVASAIILLSCTGRQVLAPIPIPINADRQFVAIGWQFWWKTG